jgi:glucose/arabinose dehydrogenase
MNTEGPGRWLAAVAACSLCALGAASSANAVPPGFTATVLASGPNDSTAMTIRPDGSILVAGKTGILRLVRNGAVSTIHTFTNVSSSGESGFIGLALDPQYATNGYVYCHVCVTTAPAGPRIYRLTLSGDTVVAASQTELLNTQTDVGGIHQGGALEFGNDGKLYMSIGDNGSSSNGQSMTTLRGKVLRMNPDGSVPPDNPFAATLSGNLRLIWTLGLRNPFTLAVQRSTGRLFINDVGSSFEEINEGVPGRNYGWSTTNGPFSQTQYPNFTLPLLSYPTMGNAIAGGAFYEPAALQFPSTYTGKYFYADYVRGWIRVYDPITDTDSPFTTTTLSSIVDLDVTADGRLLVLRRNAQMIMEIKYTLGACCTGTACALVTQAACTGAFTGLGSACGPAGNPTTCCPVNFDAIGGVTIDDIFIFLNAWFMDAPGTDFDHSGSRTVDDIFIFLNAWFNGC